MSGLNKKNIMTIKKKNNWFRITIYCVIKYEWIKWFDYVVDGKSYDQERKVHLPSLLVWLFIGFIFDSTSSDEDYFKSITTASWVLPTNYKNLAQ